MVMVVETKMGIEIGSVPEKVNENVENECVEISNSDGENSNDDGGNDMNGGDPDTSIINSKKTNPMVILEPPSELPFKSDGENQPPKSNSNDDGGNDINGGDRDTAINLKRINPTVVIEPHSELPKPEAPAGLFVSPSPPSPDKNSSKLAKFIRERSNNFSAAIAKKLYSLKENIDEDAWAETVIKPNEVTQYNIPGLKVIVKINNRREEEGGGGGGGNQRELKGRVSFFSRSNCRDCKAVRSFFKQKGLRFVEINMDVYPQREKELIRRTGSSQVPQIFFNEKLFGGLVALNSLRNSGTFDERFREMLGKKCSSEAPAPPLYGFDDHDEEESTDEMVPTIKLLRQRLPIQDRLIKLKIVKNCFSGSEMVDVLTYHFHFDRMKAIEIGKQLSRKHFIHHVFGENEFEDGNHFYRFLEHEPYIPKCYNFRVSTNDTAPKPAVLVGQRLNKLMSAILEAYASDDRCHVDYVAISKSEEFRRYVNLAHDLQRVNLYELSPDEKLAFFLNLYNAMNIHAIIRLGHPEGVIDRKSFSSDFQYVVGGYPYSMTMIKNGILRNNRRGPYSLVKPFGSGDKRLELCGLKVNPLIHFGLCNGTRSSPTVRFFTAQGVESELRVATREFFQSGGMEVDLEKRTVYLTRILKWFNADFGQEKEILKWSINYLDATKAGLLSHLMDDGCPFNIVYQNYDWSVNS